MLCGWVGWVRGWAGNWGRRCSCGGLLLCLLGRLLALGGLLDGAEDHGYLALEGGEFEVDDAAAGVENDVDGNGEGGEIFADGLAHAALDAVAVDGLAHDFAYGEADARTGGVGVAEGRAVGAELRAQSEEVGHLLRELLAAGLV